MHLVESTTYGSTIAAVGHASKHAVQVPQWSSTISVSYSSSIFKTSEPMNTHEPCSLVIRFECFPSQPSPARTAQALSIKGTVSMHIFPTAKGASDFIHVSNSFSFSRTTL